MILCIAQVEDQTNIKKQIAKQTVQPDEVYIYIDTKPAIGINERRIRIAENHLILAEAVRAYKPDLIWQLEGDCELEEDTLERLLLRYDDLKGPDFGYVSGIQVGRHGLYCLGAWRNFTDTSFESIDYKLTGLQEVEATGFYCLLAETNTWLSGKATWTHEPYGPDVVWARSISKKKYVDMGLGIGHIVKRGIIYPRHASTCNARFYLENGRWKYKTYE